MNVLIIGLGSIGKKHLKSIKTVSPHAAIFALRSGQDAEVYPDVTNIYEIDSIASILFDFAIIANPTAKHKETIEKLIDFGFPLFIEKPLYSSLDIVDLIENIQKKGTLTYVACNLRFLECIVYIKEQLLLLKNKKLNEVNVYCGSYIPDWRPNVDFRKTYSVNAELGGGVHLDLIHELDYLYWLFGTPQEVKRYFKSQSSLSIPTSDYANYLLEYQGFCVNVVLNYYRKDPKRSLEMVFEDGTWTVDLLKNQVTCDGQILFLSKQNIADTYYLQMQYFMSCISGKNATFNTVYDAYEVLKICLNK